MPGHRHLGDRAPYTAVINLVAITAHHWRTVRSKLRMNGITNPMAMLNLHELIDTTENMVLESYASKDPKKDERDREQFLDSLYKPTREAVAINGDGYKPIPAGFDDGGEDAFDNAMTSLGAE